MIGEKGGGKETGEGRRSGGRARGGQNGRKEKGERRGGERASVGGGMQVFLVYVCIYRCIRLPFRSKFAWIAHEVVAMTTSKS